MNFNNQKGSVNESKKPILLVVMDGVGFCKTGLGDAVTLANTSRP